MYHPFTLYEGLTVISIIFGPVLLMVLRGSAVSPLEKFIYVTAQFPLILLFFIIRYVNIKKLVVKDSDPQMREERLVGLNREYRQLLLIVIPASVIGVALCAWLVFSGVLRRG